MRDIARLGIVLLVVCAVAAAALSMVYDATKDKIAAQQEKAQNDARKAVLPQAVEFREDQAVLEQAKASGSFPDVQDIYSGYDALGSLVGYAVTVAPYGYSSNIVTLVGVTADGALQGATVVQQSETPGLGAKVKEAKFIGQFGADAGRGYTTESTLKVNKDGGDIQAITGATISSRAATKGVNEALGVVKGILDGTFSAN